VTTKLLLHGVPETAAIWTELIAELSVDGDVRTLSLPGFGTPRPDGFDCSMQAYAAWLTAEVDAAAEETGGPVDLVGHDWGGILTARLAMTPPAGLRSWTTDAPGALREGFVWHDLGLLWRTEGAGEDFWAGLLADRSAAAELLTGFGLTLDHAALLVNAADEQMVDSILRLYRSSDGLGTEWLITGPSERPGLVIGVADDPLGSVHVCEEMATRLGADVAVLDLGGHFWPLEAPAAGAAALAEFWAGLDAR